jgi:hypothetical protein
MIIYKTVLSRLKAAVILRRRCEYYFLTERLFCECCGMRLRASPANREYKEKVRAKKRLVDV